MTESKNQQKKQEKEWSKEDFIQEITKRKESLGKTMKHYKPVRMWKYVALTSLPYVVYWLVYMFICAKGIEVSVLFCIGGLAIAFLVALLLSYMLRVRDMQRALSVTMETAELLSFFIDAKVKKPLKKEKK